MTDAKKLRKLSKWIYEVGASDDTGEIGPSTLAINILDNTKALLDVLVEVSELEHDGDWPESGTFYRLPHRTAPR
jgi:hypothetical protein